MLRAGTERLALTQRGSRCVVAGRFASASRSSPLRWSLGVCALCALLVGSCHSAKSKQSAPVGSAAVGGSGQGPSQGSAAGASGGEGPKAASPSALSAERRARLTTIRVSAHVGNVIIRREANAWGISGPDGCAVRSARLERALDNLSVLKAVPTNEAVPDGTGFQLQITALVGEEPAVHLEIADNNATGHLTRLNNDSMVRIQGLDVGLWSPNPADWCKGP